MPANNLQILQTQLLTLRRQEAGILSIQSTLGGQVSAVEPQLDEAVLVAEAATAALSAIQTTVATVSNTQTSLDSTLGTVQADINRVDSQVTSASSSSGHTRDAVQSLVQQLVHPDATWEEGSSSYTLPVDAVPIYQAIQNETTSLDARVTAAATGSSSSPPSVSTGSLRLHIDASDDNSLWTDNSMTSKVTTGEVRFVKDLSGSGHHLQYNSGNLITTGTSTNGDTTLRTISHDSGGQAGYNWQGVLLSDTAATGGVLFMVIKQTDGSGSGGFMVPDWATLPDTANTNPSAVYPGVWMGDGASAYMWPAGGQHQLVIFRGDPTANVSRLYAMAAGAYDNSPLVTSPYSTELLARPVMCHHYRGETCEVLYYTGVMSDEDFNSTALYLLNKWLGPSTA